jgi:archaeosortase A (PGF-CTERM-specific)
MNKSPSTNDRTALLFVLLPTIYVLLALFVFTYPLDSLVISLLPLPIFAGLFLLLLGAFLPESSFAKQLRIIGWIVFSFYWATQPQTLYYAEQQDIFNAIVSIIGIYVLFYLAYHDWFSLKTKESIDSLRWIAGASALAGLIYFIVDLTPLAEALINIVSVHSGWLLNMFICNVTIDPPIISYLEASIRIIFACTAVQSMVLFVGMILPLPQVRAKRKLTGVLITVIPVYVLNLVRNASIVYLVGIYGRSFFGIAHNYIGKAGSLIALIILLFIVAKILPEIFDNILELIDLPKRKAPIEEFFRTHIWGRK